MTENTPVGVADAIERATISSDPAVRSAAIRYRTLEQELQGLESFFAFYGRARVEADAQPSQSTERARPGPNGRVTAEFIGKVRDLLVKRGEPLRMNRLYEVFYQEYPDQGRIASEVFRQRLVKQRALIRHVENVGFWPTDLPLPGAKDDS